MPVGSKTPLYALAFLASMGYGVILPGLALYASSLGSSYSLIGLIVSVYAAAQLVAQVPVGRLSDRIGRKKLVVTGFVGIAVAALLYNFGREPIHIFAFQALAGLANGCLWPPILAQLTEQTRATERGKVMGIFNTVFFMGVGLGPLVGGYVSSSFGNMVTFNLWASIAVVGLLTAILAFKETPGLAKSAKAQAGASPKLSKLVKDGTLTSFVAACAVRSRGGLCTSFNNAILPLYASFLFLDIPRTMIGGLMFAHGVTLALFNFPGGMLSDRFGRKWPPICGSLVATIGVLWYSFPNGYWALVVAVALAGAGSAATSPGLAALVGDIASPSRRGEAFGFFQTSFHLGMVFGASAFGFLADLIGLPFSVLSWGVFSLALSLAGLLIKSAVARPVRLPA